MIKREEFKSKLSQIGLCSSEDAGQLFNALQPDQTTKCLDFKMFHTGMEGITSNAHKSIDPRGLLGNSSVPHKPRPLLLHQPLDSIGASHEFRKSRLSLTAEMVEREFHHDTKGMTEVLPTSQMYMSDALRFDRARGHRERFLLEEKAKREKLLQDKVANKHNILTMYEDLKSKSEWRQQQRVQANIESRQARQRFHDQVDRFLEEDNQTNRKRRGIRVRRKPSPLEPTPV